MYIEFPKVYILTSLNSQRKDEGIKKLININNRVSKTYIALGSTIIGQ